LSLVLKFSLHRIIACKTAVFLCWGSSRLEDFEVLLLRLILSEATSNSIEGIHPTAFSIFL